MSGYNFNEIETKWQKVWDEQKVYQTSIDNLKPKFYALDMFPYPSGAGLHVGHPLGYIASDIVSRYKRLNGFNVLHPMGFDAFGLPAEQYAIQTGQHPAITTAKNITRYKEQLNRIGFSFDWSREVQTCDPTYYKWTQWIFIQLFESWYNTQSNKAERIDQLILIFENDGNANVKHWGDEVANFSAEEWENFSTLERETILQCYRLAYQKETTVNWCEELGTVLANDEVKDGKSERGGYPVTQKLMKQWYLRITAYADRLLEGLDTINWSDSLKEMQRNWIGKSVGASLKFKLQKHAEYLEVFTTRPDTLFGATFMVVAPEHELIKLLITEDEKELAQTYISAALNKTERERMMNKDVSGAFTGSYVIHPFTEEKLPIYVAEYVLGGYGSGAIMAVPAHDERDHKFAKHFNLEIKPVIDGGKDVNYQEESYDAKEGTLINSHNFDRLKVNEGAAAIIQLAEERGFGKRQTNFKLRDAGYSRQRYWGEPFPIVYQGDVPQVVTDLPVELPEVESYKPTGTGESPLASNKTWVNSPEGKRETDTMPGYAGSSWYFLRYMDPNNSAVFAGKEALEYWNQVDLYIGGTEHATGHLLYARFWTKFLYDHGHLNFDEPFKQLVNQGMIQGESMLLNANGRLIHVPVALANKDATLTKEQFLEIQKTDNRFDGLSWDALSGDDNLIHLETQVEKMSKSKLNVVNPDDICAEYGADTLRLYEMFLGPLEDSKPWSTNGIDGTHRFLKKLWALFYNQDNEQQWDESEPTNESLKSLHQTIKKVTEDIQNFSFNTSVSQFMICVNELGSQKCKSKSILEKLLVLVAPFAPHIAEELWNKLGNRGLVINATWPEFEEEYLIESTKTYPISINGKTRTTIDLPLDMPKEEIEKVVLANEIVQKWLEGNAPRKIIVVPGRIVNVVK